MTGELKPGQKLVERELCSSLDISRTLLREALPQLQAEGLIRSIAHKGPSVALIDADEVRQIYQIRRVLEVFAVREFVRNAGEEQIANLREQLEELKRPKATGNLRDLLVAKAGFYSALFEGSGNALISQILTQLNNRIVLCKRLSLSVSGRLPQAVRELEAVFDAIQAGDEDKAAELCELHVVNAERNVLRQLSDETEAIREQQAPAEA